MGDIYLLEAPVGPTVGGAMWGACGCGEREKNMVKTQKAIITRKRKTTTNTAMIISSGDCRLINWSRLKHTSLSMQNVCTSMQHICTSMQHVCTSMQHVCTSMQHVCTSMQHAGLSKKFATI